MDPHHGKRLGDNLGRGSVHLLLEAPAGGGREGPGGDPFVRPAADAPRGWKAFFFGGYGVRDGRARGCSLRRVDDICGVLHPCEGMCV